MFTIDKQNPSYSQRGHNIVNCFLSLAWNATTGKYIGCDFNAFKRDGAMESLLSDEQKGLCCYCMRHLEHKTHTTLEHVIPLHCHDKQGRPLTATINHYKQYGNLSKMVTYRHLDRPPYNTQQMVTPPYPHFCAYENLVLSCDGSLTTGEDNERASSLHLCCNNRRGNDKITPLFFIEKVSEKVGYDPNGHIILLPGCKDINREEFDATIVSLALEQERLALIRRTWASIAIAGVYDIRDVEQAKSDQELRINILADSGVDHDVALRLKNSTYWQLFSEYSWFYHYFKARRASA